MAFYGDELRCRRARKNPIQSDRLANPDSLLDKTDKQFADHCVHVHNIYLSVHHVQRN